MVSPARVLSDTTSPGVPVLLAFLLAGILALELAGSTMTRAGVHMEPIAWIAMVCSAFSLAAFIATRRSRRARSNRADRSSPPPREPSESLATSFARWKGGGEVLDARNVFPEFLFGADEARIALLPTGSSFLAARFPDADAAASAVRGYQEFFGMNAESVDFDGSWFGARFQTRDFASIRCDGDLLLVWTARERTSFPSRLVPPSREGRDTELGEEPGRPLGGDYDQSPCGRGPIPLPAISR